MEDNADHNGLAHSTTVQQGLVSADSQPEVVPAQCHAASAALSAGALLQLQRVEYVPVSGLHNQCFYNAVARHFSVYPHELLPVIQDTLTSIDDPVTLARYGLSVEFDADAAAVAAAKQIYLQSADTQSGAWGGSLEMVCCRTRAAVRSPSWWSTSRASARSTTAACRRTTLPFARKSLCITAARTALISPVCRPTTGRPSITT
jgi:hypothetical protein